MFGELAAPDLGTAEFQRICALVYDLAGINLHEGKEGLVRSRLSRRIRELRLGGFREYLDLVQRPDAGAELTRMIDALTTNKTSFFREPAHFDFLRRALPNALRGRRRLRIWSAGCSSGEEAYTLAMVLREALPDIDQLDVRILATDISSRVLTRAREGTYSAETVSGVPGDLLARYFVAQGSGAERIFRVEDRLRRLIRFAHLNLMAPWPMKGPFDFIFCRNVMIYFDKTTQENLIARFHRLLDLGGYLFLGHSESMTGLSHSFRYVQPAAYCK